MIGGSRSLLGLVGLLLAVVVLSTCMACDSGPATTSTTGGSDGPQEVTWERVVELVREGRVEAVSQYHSLLVQIRLADGTEYQAMEPQIDEIFRIVEEAPNRDSIILITE